LSAQPEVELLGCYIGSRLSGQQENLFAGKYFLSRWRKVCERLHRSFKFQEQSSNSKL
jgi:hypothetical protein